MVAMLIERSETRFEASYSDLTVSKNVAIYWIPDSVLCVWFFNGDINSSQYYNICKISWLTTELHMELPFDSQSIVNLCKTIRSL